MPRRRPIDYDIDFHLAKIKDHEVRRLYSGICEYAEKHLPGTEFTFNSEYTYFRSRMFKIPWYLQLFAQPKRLAINSKGEYLEFPEVESIQRGSKAKDGTINFHVTSTATWEDILKIVHAAYERVGGEVYHEPVASAPAQPVVVFFYIGWMKYYQGIPPGGGDDIKGGGGFIDEHGYGYEIFNFQRHVDKLYGYVQPVTPKGEYQKGRILIERLGAPKGAASIDGITVVFVAKSRSSRVRRVVGWYENATVFRERQSPPEGSNRTYRGEEMGYYAVTDYGNHLLLPEEVRDAVGIEVPVGKNGMGRSHVWYADKERDRPFVGRVMRLIDTGGLTEEAGDAAYQAEIHTPGNEWLPKGPIPPPKLGSGRHQQWPKNPDIARGVLRESKYSCSVDPKHKTFISRTSGKNYVEAHHLVPMSKQGEYPKVSLDVPGNIVPLCPICHRLVHFGNAEAKLPVLKDLFVANCREMKRFGINMSLEDFLASYGA